MAVVDAARLAPGRTLAYREFPIEGNEEQFQNWKCSICHDENPEAEGGTIVHESYNDEEHNIHIDGKAHPVHKYCQLRWMEQHGTCPECRALVDIGPITPLATKCWILGKQVLNSIPPLAENLWRRATHPMNEIYIGVPFVIFGQWAESPLANAVGFLIQFHAIQRSLPHGIERINLSRQIYQLAREIRADLQNLGPDDVIGKLDQLKQLILPHRLFQTRLVELSQQFDSKNRDQIVDALNRTADIADNDIGGDRFLRFWKGVAVGGAGYYGLQVMK